MQLEKVNMSPHKWLLILISLLVGLVYILGISLDIQRDAIAASLPISYENSSQAYRNKLSLQDFTSSNVEDYSNHLIHTILLLPWERANTVAFSPNGKILAVATSLGIHLYDVQTFNEIRFIKTDSWVRSIAFSSDGEMLAAGTFDNTIRLWRTSEGILLKTFEGHTSWVRSVSFTSDGSILASASDDNTVRLWRLSDGTTIYTLTNDSQGVRCIAFSPDDTLLATGTEDGLIRLYQVKDGTLLQTLDGHNGWVRTLAFSHDGQVLASGAFDATARLWRVSDGALLHTLEGHTASVLGVAFSPDDEIVTTGSVDTTIGLWGVSDGGLLNILKGHTDFIYSVAISPNGKMLVSGSEDNTVRVWDLTQSKTSIGASHQETSSDCRVCHHHRANSQTVPVIEVRCDACHLDGIGFNWCPAFPRSSQASSTTGIYPVSDYPAGVPTGNKSLGVIITSPSNGEFIYTHRLFSAPLFVTGQVLQTDGEASDVEVYLEIWSGGEHVTTQSTQILPGGHFTFNVGINPNGEVPLTKNPSSLRCTTCHNGFEAESFLPSGEINLVVVAISSEGEEARDNRWITIDVSNEASLNLQVNDALSHTPVSGLTIQAMTVLYDWRERRANAISNDDGIAQFELETLSQAPTTYQISVPEQVVDGRLYYSEQVHEVVFPRGTISIPTVEFTIHSKTGTIEGQVENEKGMPIGSVPVWAVSLPIGPTYYSESAADGSFTFVELPITKYVLFPDPDTLATLDLVSAMYHVDLFQLPEIELSLPAVSAEGSTIRGIVRDNENGWLPFAWLQHVPSGQTISVNPTSGTWMFQNIPPGRQEFWIQAPGYYSQPLSIEGESGAEASLDTLLLRRSETHVFAWGEGEIIIPPESNVEIKDHQITFQSGWIWGQGEGDSALVIKTPEAEIEMQAASFALERIPQKTSWFYLLEGQAIVKSDKATETEVVRSGMVVALEEGSPLLPIPFEPVMMDALHPIEEPPLTPIRKPGVLHKIQEYMTHFGIGIAQVITLITYIVAVLSLVLAPLLTVRWFIRYRKDHRGNK